MANFQGSLQDWRRYIDEKTRAVKDRKEGRAADPDTDGMAAADETRPDDPSVTASDEVEAILAKHKAIAEEINLGDAPVETPPAPLPPPTLIEAAEMFSRLPRHIQLLMQPARREVAQNSYKSKFTETREELIMRLLDPQLTLEETARILNVCPTTVRRYTNRGMLRQERTQGNHRRFRLSNVLEFLEKNGTPDL